MDNITNISPKKVRKIQIGEVVYSLRKPTVKESIANSKKFSAASTDSETLEASLDSLAAMGIPKDVLYELDMDQIGELSDYLNEDLSRKK